MQCLEMIKVRHGENIHTVACGKCAYCLVNKRSQWMFRIAQEMRTQVHKGYFLTLTYDEKHVARTASGRLSLRFRDVQLYLKRFRKEKFYVKYICVGEYGSDTERPHYHMLLWTDAPVEFIQRNWKSSKDDTVMGSIHFGALTMASAMYTLKYIIQPKVKYEDEVDCFGRNVAGREKTRAQFSKGLGLSYLTTAMYNYHTEDYDNPVMFGIVDGRKVALPRYYKNKIFTKEQMRKEASKTKWESIREKREQIRQVIKQGLVTVGRHTRNACAYLKALRVENARRILATTKYNQNL